MIIIEASDGLSHRRFCKLLASSLSTVPIFRSHLVGKPLGLGQPIWAEVDDYDPTPQIHSVAVPAPHDGHEFDTLIGQLVSETLDRHSPLWDAWSIEGLEGGRWALAIRTSPAVTKSLAEGLQTVWARLVTPDRRPELTDIWRAEPGSGPKPADGQLILDTMFELFENLVLGSGLIMAAVPAVWQAAGRNLRATVGRRPGKETSAREARLAPAVFNAPLTPRRAVAFDSVRLSHLKAIAYAFGSGVNDVALAACTLSLRTWLRHHDVDPQHPLVMRVQRSLLDADSNGGAAFARINLPVDVDDPVQILLDLHANVPPQQPENTCPADDFSAITSLLPPSVVHAGRTLATSMPCRRRPKPRFHGTISYVPGSVATCYCSEAKVVGMHALTPLASILRAGGC